MDGITQVSLLQPEVTITRQTDEYDEKKCNSDSDADKHVVPENVGQFWRKKRYLIAILTFFGVFWAYALRTNLNVAIVDMTQLKEVILENKTIVLKRECDWDSTIQGYILSSFYYGYIFTQILGGYLATRFGGTRVFGAGIASTAVFTILTPLIAKTNVYLLIAVRTLMGLLEGATVPALLSIWSNWAPPLEKARLISFTASGTFVGNVVAMVASSAIATAFGWEIIFYVFGVSTLLWYLIWFIIVADSPAKDSRIRTSELKYITESINATKTAEKLLVPWISIFRSKAVWAISISLMCETWGWFTLSTYLPKMMFSLLGFDLNKSGVLSALPHIATTFTVQLSGLLADWILSKKYLSATGIRRATVFIGFISQTIFLLATALWISPITTPCFLILGTAFGGFASTGLLVSALDLAPKFAGVIYGICNTFGTIPGIISPTLTGYIVTDPTNVDQWRIVYYISAAVYLVGAIIGTMFISGKLQPWSGSQTNENKENVESNIQYETNKN